MNIWNLSWQQWARFVSGSVAYQRNMDLMVQYVLRYQFRTIIDLCCGSGHLSVRLAQALPDCQLYYVDASPLMLEETARAIDNSGTGILLDLTADSIRPAEYFAKAGFADILLSHISLPLDFSEMQSLIAMLEVSDFCLTESGRVVISLNNTAFKIDGDIYNPSHDDFRLRLTAIADDLGMDRFARPQRAPKVTADDFDEAIDDQGAFEVQETYINTISFTLEERKNLWKIPAIIDRIYDYRRIDSEVMTEFIARLEQIQVTKQPLPMKTVNYVLCRK